MTPTLLHVFYSLAVGGQQTRFVTIANHLGRRFRHQLVSLDGDISAVSLLERDLDFTVLPAPAPARNIAHRLSLIAAFDAHSADVVVTYNWGSIEWAAVNRIWFRRPHVHLEDGFGPDEAHGQKRRRILLRRLALDRSVVVVPSHGLTEIAKTCWKIDPTRVRYIPNGIDARRFDDISRSGAPFFLRDQRICIIGAFSPLRAEKNVGRLLRSFAGLLPAPVHLVICGDGPERQALAHLAEQLGVAEHVTFVGHVPKPEHVMGAFDIFAITSDTEQMPYAVLEAMAARLPIVGTDVGDIATMVAPENRRFIVPREAPGDLVAALAVLSENAGLRRQLGAANRARVEACFGVAPMAEAFQTVFLEAARRPESGHQRDTV